MASTEQLFIATLRSDHIRDVLLTYLSISDICAVRKASSACCNLVTKRLFTRIHVTFTPNTFTRPSRIAALGRIGHHIEHLTFCFAHSDATFLPPLIHPRTGEEISFLYKPLTTMESALTRRPKYANTELGEILTQQYPPLFHAATNVPSFIYAMGYIPNMRHLTVRCPGQDPRERYRRDVVDYALISLRIAVERAPMVKLSKLSLSSLHPAAFNCLKYINGIGSLPSANRRWQQIKKLHITVESWDFYGPSPGLDHLKVLDDYIRCFSQRLDKFTFAWVGAKGPCPIALSADPLFAPSRNPKKLFHEITSPMSPLPALPFRSPMHFPKLRYLQIRNATMNSPQLKSLIASHQKTVKQFGFENVVLTNGGNWEETLASVTKSDDDQSRSRAATPLEYLSSPVASLREEGSPSPSAAAEIASRELMDLGLGLDGLTLDDNARNANDFAGRETDTSVSTSNTGRRIRRHHRKHSKDEKKEQTPEYSYPLSPPLSSHSHKSSSSVHRQKPSKVRFSLSSDSSQIAYSAIPEPLSITSPIIPSSPQPILLQPAIYSPYSPRQAGPNEGMSTVQRSLETEREGNHRLFAEDADARANALQKAKEAVLAKLSKEFYDKKSKNKMADTVSARRYMNARDFNGYGRDVAMGDWRAADGRSAMVPLIYSPA